MAWRAPACSPARALGTAALPAAAQTPGEKFVADFERIRVNVLAMVDAMPAEGLRSAPTPGVRDFAQQIEHLAVDNAPGGGAGTLGPEASPGPVCRRNTL
ncbi:MAG: hypothetical protein WEB88_03825 [Gemmatimonadota bacterium]